MKHVLKLGLSTLLALTLAACMDSDNYAPVTDIAGMERMPSNGIYRVKQGDTLYSIAWRYGLDYRDLAARNHINEPYEIHWGDQLALRGQSRGVTAPKPVASVTTPVMPVKQISAPSFIPPVPKEIKEPQVTPRAFAFNNTWIWPAKGQVATSFAVDRKGINIAGYKGESIVAAAAGKVVYAGDGLRGYGNLIILKHDNVYLSAYAYNRRVLVKEGDWVRQGQKIAEMGNSVNDRAMLHFEVRREGKPINPIPLLSS